jgi:LysM repeat protein
MNEAKYWILANKAAKEIGWYAETIFSQWVWETAHFTSLNLKNNNNIAGQTWYAGCGYEKGTPRPKVEGGYYIKYADAAQGYVDFIKKNKRYSKVKDATTVEGQIDAIAKAGWAIDPNYAKGLKSVHLSNIKKGVYSLPRQAPTPVKKENIITYTIKKGDNLTHIAKAYKTSIDKILKLNTTIKNPNIIVIGKKIKIPDNR